MALNKNKYLLESYLDSSDEEDDEEEMDEEEDKPENHIPLFKRHPLEGKNIPVFKKT